MSLFTVNPDLCTSCGFCAAECPMKIIVVVKKSLPAPINNADALCIDCGHCVAVCPHDALSHRCGNPNDFPRADTFAVPGPAEIEHILRTRRSIRNYKQTPVDVSVIRQVISAARYAPSGHNTQPVSWHIVYDTSAVRQLTAHVVDWMRSVIETNPDMARLMHFGIITKAWDAGNDSVCRNAPHLVLACGNPKNPMARDAALIALTYFDLAAPSFGLGCCWAGYFTVAANAWAPLKEALALSSGQVCMGTMMAGYPQYRYKRMPERKKPVITGL